MVLRVKKINYVGPTMFKKKSNVHSFSEFLKYVCIFPYSLKTVPNCSFELELLFVILIFSKFNSLKCSFDFRTFFLWLMKSCFKLVLYFLIKLFSSQCQSFVFLQKC